MKQLLVLFFALFILNCSAEEPIKKVKLTKTGDKYNLTIKNNSGKVIYKVNYFSSPIIKNHSDSLVSIKVSFGSPNSQTIFYSKEKELLSKGFENVLAINADTEMVVYSELNKVAINDIFSTSEPVFIERNYSPTAAIVFAINKITFEGEDKLKLNYMVGPDYTDKEEIITIKDLK